jgi:hypothetical protein
VPPGVHFLDRQGPGRLCKLCDPIVADRSEGSPSSVHQVTRPHAREVTQRLGHGMPWFVRVSVRLRCQWFPTQHRRCGCVERSTAARGPPRVAVRLGRARARQLHIIDAVTARHQRVTTVSGLRPDDRTPPGHQDRPPGQRPAPSSAGRPRSSSNPESATACWLSMRYRPRAAPHARIGIERVTADSGIVAT